MTVVFAILKALASLPAIFSFIERVVGEINEYIRQQRIAEQEKKFKEEAGKVQAAPGPQKDTCELEKMLDPSKSCGPKP
jgi:hypothetical protein